MRARILILFLFCSCHTVSFVATENAKAIAPAVNWNTGNEAAVTKYSVQSVSDTLKGVPATFTTVSAGKSFYSVSLPFVQSFWRIMATGQATFYTEWVQVFQAPSGVNITNAVYKTTSLAWTVSNAVSVASFYIDKTTDGKTYSKTSSVTFKGNGNYTLRISRTTKKYTYRITGIFSNRSKSTPTNFN